MWATLYVNCLWKSRLIIRGLEIRWALKWEDRVKSKWKELTDSWDTNLLLDIKNLIFLKTKTKQPSNSNVLLWTFIVLFLRTIYIKRRPPWTAGLSKQRWKMAVAHLHKCIIMPSDHVHTHRLELLVRLAVQITVASFKLHRCQNAMNDSAFATITLFFFKQAFGQRLSDYLHRWVNIVF